MSRTQNAYRCSATDRALTAPPRVAVWPDGDDRALRARAEELAAELVLPLVGRGDEGRRRADAEVEARGCELLLVVTEARLELRENRRHAPGPVFVDFVSGAATFRRRGGRRQRELLTVAVGARRGRRPSVVDATAGLGRDTFVLALHGCRVAAVERSPVIAALLRDGLRRAAPVSDLQDAVGRITLIEADARQTLDVLADDDRPDVVYLDPMYPARRRESAQVKKEMRLLRRLLGDDADIGELFDVARRTARRRVVVKRPLHAAPLAPSLDVTYKGKSTRFDIYLCA